MKLLQLKNLVKPLIAAIIVGAVFVTYMYFIGIPKTKAAGYFQLAQQQAGLGAKSTAEEYFQKAIQTFPENYFIQEYEKFKAEN